MKPITDATKEEIRAAMNGQYKEIEWEFESDITPIFRPTPPRGAISLSSTLYDEKTGLLTIDPFLFSQPLNSRAEIFTIQHLTYFLGSPHKISFQIHHCDYEKMSFLERVAHPSLKVTSQKIDDERFEFSLIGKESRLITVLEFLKTNGFMGQELYDLITARLKLSLHIDKWFSENVLPISAQKMFISPGVSAPARPSLSSVLSATVEPSSIVQIKTLHGHNISIDMGEDWGTKPLSALKAQVAEKLDIPLEAMRAFIVGVEKFTDDAEPLSAIFNFSKTGVLIFKPSPVKASAPALKETTPPAIAEPVETAASSTVSAVSSAGVEDDSSWIMVDRTSSGTEAEDSRVAVYNTGFLGWFSRPLDQGAEPKRDSKVTNPEMTS